VSGYNVLSLFSGAGGLDIGFEMEGFEHLELVEFDDHCAATLCVNRPNWKVYHGDVYDYQPSHAGIDVLIGGPPCQGFSLGGNRDEKDPRNRLFLEMVRVAEQTRPQVVVIENVLNLRTMTAPWSGKNFAVEISSKFAALGYSVGFDVFKVCYYGVPQTRRRFVFVACKGEFPEGYDLPPPSIDATAIRPFLADMYLRRESSLPNHNPEWGFQSRVHTNRDTLPAESILEAVPIRISRTGSDGFPIRSLDEPFPAIDTATVWGWAAGKVQAARYPKDRRDGKFVRNPEADVTLWRIEADQIRTFTHREYARLQTFPDSWVFCGKNKRDIHKQIGNAVPIEFARHIARNVRALLDSRVTGSPFEGGRVQLRLDL
jgi:DNA (cytosine-5)-methyltransferase 1